MSSENDPRYSILVGGLGVGDAYFDNGGVLPAEGGIAPFAVTSTGQLTTYSAIDQAAVEATVTYPGAEHSAQIWGVTLMGAIVTESTIGGQTYTEVSHQPLNLSSGGLLLTSAAFAGSTGSAVPTTAAFIAGTDGTDLRGLSVSSAGVLNVSDGTSHTALSSILSALSQFGFDGSGNLKVNVEVDAGGGGSDPSVGVIGDTAPLSAIFIGATDGTNLQGVGITGGDGGSLNVFDASFQEALQEDSITTDSGLPILAITPTPDTWAALQLNAEGELLVSSSGAAIAAAVPADATYIAGTDGTDLRGISVSTAGVVNVSDGTSHTALSSILTQLDKFQFDGSGNLKANVEAGTVAATQSGSWTVAATGTVSATQGTSPWVVSGSLTVAPSPNQQLLAPTNETITATVTSLSETATTEGQCVVVTLTNVLASSQWGANVSVRVRDTTSGIVTGWQSAGLLFVGESTSLYFNLPVTSGDTVIIDVIAPSAIGASGVEVSANMTPVAVPTQLRPDGRGMPLQTNIAFAGVNGTGPVTVVSAPGAGFRILLAALLHASGTSGSFTQAAGTINGSTLTIDTVWGVSALTFMSGPGVLLDPATAVTIVGNSGQQQCSAFYDIVPI